MRNNFAEIQAGSINAIDTLLHSFVVLMPLLVSLDSRAEKQFTKFLKTKKIKEINKGNASYFKGVKLKDDQEFEKLHKHYHTTNMAPFIVSKSLFVSLFSQFDTYLASLLKLVFNYQPEILNSSEKALTYSKFKDFSTIEEIKNYILDKEVDSILREKSYTETIKYIESRLGIEILNKLTDIWKVFIESSERRNLCVHNDGIVNEQYLSICAYWKSPLEKNLRKGQELVISPPYFRDAYINLYEIIIILSQIIWRKLISKELHQAEHHLDDIVFNLLKEKKHKAVIDIISFVIENFNFSQEQFKLICIINLALAYKLTNNKAKANELLDDIDWSACSDLLTLSVAVIKEDKNNIKEYMLKIGSRGEIKKEFYRTWPLFISIEQNKTFYETFEKVFKEPYRVIGKSSSANKLITVKHQH